MLSGDDNNPIVLITLKVWCMDMTYPQCGVSMVALRFLPKQAQD